MTTSDPAHPQRTVVLQDEALRRLRGFTAIPNVILRHRWLSYGAKVTFGVLLSYAWQDNFCWPAQERLAQDLVCSERQVRRFLQELKTHGIIDWKQQGLNLPNIYYILPQARWSPVPKANPDRTDLSGPVRTTSDRTSVSAQDRTPLSAKEDSMKKTHINVDVGESSEGTARRVRTAKTSSQRRWKLTDAQLDEAEGIAQIIADGIGQPGNRNSYFVCAADALAADRADLIFEAISITKGKIRVAGIETTPSQYFHRVFRQLLKKGKITAEVALAREQGRAARDRFTARSAFDHPNG